MNRVTSAAELRQCVAGWRRAGQRIAFVPTMGGIHRGHTRLVEVAAEHADRVVTSLFVNPTQFDQLADFERYPRQFERDAELLQTAGCELLFAPAVETLYPLGLDLRAWVDVERGAAQLEGAHRPGHFRGVATVVTKLLNLVAPDLALFGEKDYEQLLVVRMLVRELLLPVQIVAVPTVREADGLALSSRNTHLDAAERERAPELYRTLQWAAAQVARDTARAGSVEAQAQARLEQAGFRVDYFHFCDAELAAASDPEQEWRVLAAAWLGATRLIDNLGFRPADGPPASGSAGQG